MKVEIKVPEVGESITEVTLSEWFKSDGDYVKLDEAICELESDKATFELPAEHAGRLIIKVEAGTDINVGDVIALIDKSAEAPADEPAPAKEDKPESKPKEEKEAAKEEPAKKAPMAPEATAAKSSDSSYAEGHPSPAAAKMMREGGVSASNVSGSGPGGRIVKQDVMAAMANGIAGFPTKRFSRDTRKEKMSRLRRTIAANLVNAKNGTAMLTTFNEVDMSAVMELRKQYKDKFKEVHGVGLGFMSFFTRACCIALQKFPAVNGQIEDDHVIYHDFCDISIAVSTPRGLVVPVIRNAESLSMAEIEKKIVELATKGRDNELTLDEMTGGTFTISNGGVFGSLMSTPILNAPQSAVLGMHKIEERPVVIDGKVEVRPMMYLAVSYDHRIIDGKESVSFLVKIKEMLENPSFMLLGKDPAQQLLDL